MKRAKPVYAAPTAEELIHRHSQLKSARDNFDSQRQEIKDLIWPDGGDFTTTREPGQRTNVQIYDMHAALYAEQGASALETYLTPRTQQWHRLTASEPKLMEAPRVKEFFETSNDVLFKFRNSPRAQFYGSMHEGWKSTLVYGDNCIRVRELPRGGTDYRYIHVGQTWIDVDADNVVDTIFYAYPLTAKAAIGRWGAEAPRVAKDAIGTNPSAKHKYLHCVYPNPEHDPKRLTPEGMRFTAYEVCIDSKEILERGGYHELPYKWSRYTVNPGEMYGRGAGMLVRPDIKTLNEMQRVFLRSGQKVADPPLLAIDDGALGRGNKRIRLQSGAITMGGLDSQGRPMVMPLQTGARLDITLEMMNSIRELIRKAFLVDVWEILVQDRVQMTATEVLERKNEKGQLLAPVIGRQQSELLGPMIEREIAIAQRQGKLPPLPPELIEAQGDYEIEYESDATRMQKGAEVAALSRTFEAVAPFLQANPSLLELWKQDETIRSTYQVLGGSTRNLRSASDYAQVQQAVQQAAQQQSLMDSVPGAAKGLRDVAAAGKDLRVAA